MEVSGQLHGPDHFTPGERTHGTHRIGGWVGPKADLDGVAKRKNPCPYRESKAGCPARSLVTILAGATPIPQITNYTNIKISK